MKKYRIVKASEYRADPKYVVERRNCCGIWLTERGFDHLPAESTFDTIAEAQAFIEKKNFVRAYEVI